jgi:hypothetical protein
MTTNRTRIMTHWINPQTYAPARRKVGRTQAAPSLPIHSGPRTDAPALPLANSSAGAEARQLLLRLVPLEPDDPSLADCDDV